MRVLSWGGLVAPKFPAPPSGETMRQTPNVLEVQERARGPLSPCKVWWGSDLTRRRGGQKRWVFLSVCLFVCPSRSWTSEFVRPISPWKCWSTETILMPLDRGRFVVVHQCSTFWDWWQLATSLFTKCWSPKNGKNWGFSPPQNDRINRSRQNFAGRHVPWVCYSSPNLAFIGKRGSLQEPQKCQNLPNIVVFGHRKPTQWTHSDEIWPVSVDLGSVLAHQIWPWSVKRGRYRSTQKCQNLPKLWFLATGSRHNEHIQIKFGV